MADRYLYLLRHGQYHTASEHPRHGELTGLGRRQARRVATRLRRLPIEVIRHSGVPRARETAEIIAEKLPDAPLKKSPLLREGFPSAPPKHLARIAIPKPRLARDRERLQAAHRKFFRACRGRDRHELIVGHGNAIRFLVCLGLGGDVRDWWRLAALHCGLTVIRVSPAPRGQVLVSLNDVGHLPPAMQTFR